MPFFYDFPFIFDFETDTFSEYSKSTDFPIVFVFEEHKLMELAK